MGKNFAEVTNVQQVNIISERILESFSNNNMSCFELDVPRFFEVIIGVINDLELGNDEKFEELYDYMHAYHNYDDDIFNNDEMRMAFSKGMVWGAFGVLKAYLHGYENMRRNTVCKELLSIDEYREILYKLIESESGISLEKLADTTNMDVRELYIKLCFLKEYDMCSAITLR